MLNSHQVTDLARSQAQFLSHALERARSSLEVMPSIRSNEDAIHLVKAIEEHFSADERGYESAFIKLGGFIDARLGQTPVDLLTDWISNSSDRGQLFHVLSQWSIAQRLRARLNIELAVTPMPLPALARFCIAIREEARRCVQQSGGNGASMLAEQVESFSDLIESYQNRMAAANTKRV
ncbi:MAG: hypothetical protein DDT34_02000 [Firmicutes bacterium]|nr:hypothetical protein [Bacillota bacterium]